MNIFYSKESLIGVSALIIVGLIIWGVNVAWKKMTAEIDKETERVIGKEDDHQTF